MSFGEANVFNAVWGTPLKKDANRCGPAPKKLTTPLYKTRRKNRLSIASTSFNLGPPVERLEEGYPFFGSLF